MKYIAAIIQILLLLIITPLNAQKQEEVDWLNNHISVIQAVKAGSESSDLHPLKALVGDARIVALGECTHGSREIFQLKHRLLEYLVDEMGFSIFAIEGDLALAGVINDFVVAGKGDSSSVVGSLEPVWRTQEVWEMIQWMRTYNQTKENKIQFMGFDMQIPWGALHNLEVFAKESDDAHLADWLKQVSTMQQKVEQTDKSAKTIKRHILRLSEQIENKISASEASASPFTRQNAQALVQLAKVQHLRRTAAFNARDEAMAENVEAILHYNPKAKVVLWAHNEHVKKTGGMFKTMGYYLSQKYGTAYVSVGFATGSGSFTAWNQAGVLSRRNLLTDPVENSFEQWLDQAREKNFLLNLEAASVGQQEGKWLYEKKMFRNIGWKVAAKPKYQFVPQKALPNLFNAVIYLDKTTSTNACLARE